MYDWAGELLSGLEGASSEREISILIEDAANHLGYEFCAYGLRIPWPVSRPKIYLLSNYPEAWKQRYMEAGYIDIDPTMKHMRRFQTPVVWTDAFFSRTPELWRDAQAHGLRHGWSQSTFDSCGVSGMLTLARSEGPVTPVELEHNEFRMRWLVSTTHLAMTRVLMPKLMPDTERGLTDREVEVLKWAADGKTSGEISTILRISVDTVNFHVKNAVAKLKTVNKTSAVVRAAMLGLLS
ncbi:MULTISPECIES: autoinducer binding domain-containing protein [Burkholderia]|uniref:Autoinducer-binding transcriptionalregulator, LuxR family protein n=1 Tax=Burkholderia plantarii TaxID=41899 RepID=A0A0B6RZN9_BURPL|nr:MULTISPECIES: autoinducer binding domain-containing protein [Burkholderia]AJK46550.1 autoinducer-binding transcriptionalregulator, LuxR family protein [Burkholderia plantarii]ALK30683.1 Autoinducer-binding transcriptional regulator, LuxR family [Burkholderia plantarii]WLE59409.1 autoinducer binding domain-containing protein [Burkholderia plantarii]GLZ19296.1 LuxR family transcriptional regulator [Burkholderia plantarii]